MTLKYQLNCAAFGLRLNSLRAAKGAHEDLFSFTFIILLDGLLTLWLKKGN